MVVRVGRRGAGGWQIETISERLGYSDKDIFTVKRRSMSQPCPAVSNLKKHTPFAEVPTVYFWFYVSCLPKNVISFLKIETVP